VYFADCNASALCANGAVAVGGGCDFVNPRQAIAQPATWQASYPNTNATGWNCRAVWPRNADQNAQGTITLQAFAICAQ
jgi:hypothetical protein